MKWLMVLAVCGLSAVGFGEQSARSTQSSLPAARRIDFNRDIRPILSDKCLVCHGVDAPNKKIRLRLDSEAGAMVALSGGRRAIVPGRPEQSEMVRRITADDDAERMPPVYSGRALTSQEIELLVEWIRQGAAWQKHWAFIPPVRAELPSVKNKRWPRNAIDFFVLEKLEREGLTPAPEADRPRLLRRVSLDLTGLPPTPREVDDFLNDRSSQAYEKVVDRLLNSPRYGERMAFRWLDAARYADTSGYQSDRERQMWRWRDWVIEAFNRNLPYDQFVIEQLAGDLLPNATIEHRLATGFNRNHRGNSEGGIIPEEYAVEYVVDRVDTMATVFLGLTAGCARCHHHKYDPLTQREYYQLYAYFNSIPENGQYLRAGNSPPTMLAPTKVQQQQMRRLETGIAQLELRLSGQASRIERTQRLWEQSLAGTQHWFPSDGLVARFTLDGSDSRLTGGAPKFQRGRIDQAAVFDGGTTLLVRGPAKLSETDPITLSAWIYPKAENAGAILTCAEEAEPSGEAQMGTGYGLFFEDGKISFNLVKRWEFDAIRVETNSKFALNQWHHVLASYDGRRTVHGVTVFVDGQKQVLKTRTDSISEPFSITQPWRIGGQGGAKPRQFQGLIDEARIYDVPLGPPQISVLANPNSLYSIARLSSRTESDTDKLRWAFLESTGAPSDIRRTWKRLSVLKLQRARLETKFPSVMVMQEMDPPRPAFVLKRGAYDAPGESVTRGVPAVLPPLPEGAPNNRLGLAEWLVHPRHPLTGRVAVNRIWQMLFGVGLVKTTEDFGAQGEWPSHPELLDWLAVEFTSGRAGERESGRAGDKGARRRGDNRSPQYVSQTIGRNTRSHGWDVKALLKLIVMSATYRQSSKAAPELLAKDPENRLLARAPRLRLPAEMIHDQALMVSGLLVEQLGGPSVKTYQPEGLWNDMTSSGLVYVQDRGDKLYRRSLYTYWKRTIAPPLMTNFDGAGRESCVVRESRTNTPLQALNLMNDVTFVEAARILAERALREGGRTAESRIAYAFRLVTARFPTEREKQILLGNLQAQLDEFRTDPAKAVRLLGVGEKKSDGRLNANELAAYTALASLILNLDEVVTKE